MSDKQIKITASLDPSFAQAKRAIDDLISSVGKLGDAMRSANQQFGGGGGAGGVSGNASPKPGVAGGGMTGVITKASGSGGGGGFAGGLTSGLTSQMQLFKGIAESSKNSFKIITDSLRESSRNNDREIDKNVASLKKWENAISSIEKKIKTKGSSAQADTSMTAAREGALGTMVEGERLKKVGAKLSGGLAEIEGEPAGGGGPGIPGVAGSGGRGGGGRGRAMIGSFAGAARSAAGMVGLGEFGSVISSIAGAAGPVGVALAAGYGVAKLWELGQDTELANASYNMQRPGLATGRKAKIGALWGGMENAVAHGDYALLRAYGIARESDAWKAIDRPEFITNQARGVIARTPLDIGEAASLAALGKVTKGTTGKYIADHGGVKKASSDVLTSIWNYYEQGTNYLGGK